MLIAVLIFAALIFFGLAGLNVRGPRLHPEGYAWGLVVLAAFLGPLATLGDTLSRH